MTDFLHSVQHQTYQITFAHLENRYNICGTDFFVERTGYCEEWSSYWLERSDHRTNDGNCGQENLPPCDLVSAFLSQSFGFFLTLTSCLTSLPLQFCSKAPASYRVWNSLHGMVRRCNFAVCQQVEGQETCGCLVFVSHRSVAGKPLQTAPAHQLCILEDWMS